MTNLGMTSLHLPWYWGILLWAVSCEGWTTMVTTNQGKWLFRWHNWLHPHLPALKTNPGQNIFRSFSSFVSVEMWSMFGICWWGSDARTVKRIYRWVGVQVSNVHHNVCSQVCSNSGQCLLCCVLEKKLQQPVLKDTVMSIHNTHDGQEGRDQ